jgi:uncharacterized protein
VKVEPQGLSPEPLRWSYCASRKTARRAWHDTCSSACHVHAAPVVTSDVALLLARTDASVRYAKELSVVMRVTELWRYPVKTLAGERLASAHIGPFGVDGDRVVHVEDEDGHVITSRSHPRFLGHRGTLGSDGEPLVDGRRWDSAQVAEEVLDIAGPGARLVRYDGVERFDVLPLLVATDGAIAAFGHDGRRLRPNIVVGGVEGMAEREWPGACLRINQVVIGIQDLRQRCIMTSFDPDTLVQDKLITRDIFRRFEGKLALDCFVIAGGDIAVGDEVTLVRGRGCAGSMTSEDIRA